MAIVQISKIQHRTGANTDLPQLDVGEIGFSTDTQQVFIGNDPVLVPIDPNVSFTTQTELLTEVSLLNNRVPYGTETKVFAPLAGAGNTVFNIQNIRTGQLIIGNGDGVAANTLVNWTGNLIGNGADHPTNKLKLGGIANIMITGGTTGSVLSTDGSGNLSWQSSAGGGGVGVAELTITTNGKFLTNDGSTTSWSNTLPSWAVANVRSSLSVISSGDSSLAYDNANGVFTYTGSNATQVRSYISSGTGVTYAANGQISIGQDVANTASVTFDNITGSNLILNTLVANSVLYTSSSGSTVSSSSDFTYNNNTLTVGKIVTVGAIEVGTLFKSNLTTQTGASDGLPGQICWDADYMYVCTSTNVWKRVALTAF